jgi:hypothetical protein
MSNKDSTPSGSSLDIAGRVTSIVTDLTNQVSAFANDVGNALTGGFTDSRSAPVPGTAEEQTTQAEARTPRPSNAFASADLLFNQNTALLLNENRNNRHKRIISENKFAVRIRSILNKDVVAFHVPPEINESRTTAYKSLDPVHMPGAIQVYQNSSPRTWNLGQIKLISRNGEEAEENLATVNQLRAWMMPFFGDSNTAGLDGYGPNLLGSPPEVLEFTAYSDIGDSNSGSGKGNMTNIRKIPVVLTSLIIPYPTDVDYIQTAQTKQPFPAVTSIDLILVETHSPKQLSEFNLIDFRHGQLEGF